MSLDLGELLGSVDLIITPFERKYGQVVSMMARLGLEAEKSGAATGVLDEGLAGVAKSSNAATAGLTRANQAMRGAGLSASDAAAANRANAAAISGTVDVTTEAGLAQSRLTQATLRQTVAQERLNTLEASGTATTARLAGAQASLIAANDRVALSAEKVSKAQALTSKYSFAKGPLLAAGVAVAAMFGYAGKAATQFDAKMTLVQTLSKATADEMAGLRDAALHVGQAYGFSAGEVADAEAELVKAGVSVKDILGGALTGALTLAAAGQEDVAAATETATIAMTQFKLEGKDVPHVADLLAAGADKALGSVAELSDALKYGGLASAQADQSIEATIGTLAEFAQAGLMGSSAGSALAMMLTNLEHASTPAQAMLDKYNISLYNADGTTRSYTQVAGMLHNSLSALPAAERNAALATIFTSRARRAATILTNDGAKVNAEWIKSVNDQGFAALQASGKLNSLAGDWTKLKTAMQTAFIGSGEGAQGPLRSLVQDITALLNAWNGLPGPVRAGIQVLTAVGGAAALAGAAALIAVPKWLAMNAAIEASGRDAITTRGALGMLGKTAGVVAGIAALVVVGKELQNTFSNEAGPSVNDFTSALVDLANGTAASGNATSTWARQTAQALTIARMPMKFAIVQMSGIDAALAGLVTSGHLDQAQAGFAQLSTQLHAVGLTTAQINQLFPQFAGALSDSATSAKVAGTNVDQFGNNVSSAADKTAKATAAIKAYSDALHAQNDPLFAMNQALQDLATKQAAADKAIRKHGADSKQARQANLDLASSSLDVEAASQSLAKQVQAGTVSIHAARGELKAWVADGLLTKKQADSVTAAFGGLIGKAQQLSGIHPHVRVTADTSAANTALDALGHRLGAITGHVWDAIVHVFTSGSGTPPQHHATGGLIRGGGTSTSDSIPSWLSTGEYVMPADRTAQFLPFLEAMRSGHTAALRQVMGSIGAATAPAVTDPGALAAILAGTTRHAVHQRIDAQGAKRHAADVRDWAKAWAIYAKETQHAANVADRAAQKHSKDKHLQQVAHDADQAAKAAQRMANQTSKAADKAAAAYTKLANSAKSSAQKAGAAAQALVTELQSEIDSIASAVSDFESSISQGLTSGHGLSDVWQNLLDSGKATVTNLQGSLDDILTSTRRFDTDLQRLADEGASKDLIDQLAGMGDAGKALAEQLLAAGPGAITQLSNTLTNIQKVADSTGVALADTFYGAGLHSMERYIKGLEKKFPELRKALNPILHEINHILDGGGGSAANFAAVSIPVAGGDGAALGAGVFSSMDARLGRIETLLGAAPAAHADAVKPVLTAAADAHATRIQTIQRSDA